MPKVKKSHVHTWGRCKSSPDSFTERCACGAIRRVRRIGPGLREIKDLTTGEVSQVRV